MNNQYIKITVVEHHFIRLAVHHFVRLASLTSKQTMAHANFGKTGKPRSRNAQAQSQLDIKHAENEKKWKAYIKEKERRDSQKGQLSESTDLAKSRRL